MAAFDIPEPLGYAYKSPIRYQAMQLINTQLPKAPNFVDGGATYTPADPIVVGGAGFELDGPTVFTANAVTTFESISETTFESGATLTNNGAFYIDGPGIAYVRTNGYIIVQSTGEISVQTGGRLDVETGGAMNWRDGSLITAADGSTFQLADGSVLNTAGIVNFGSTSTITGTPKLSGGANLALSPARSWTRRNLRMCATANPAEATESGSDILGAGGNFIPSIKIGSTDAGSPFATLLEIDDLPHGQTITSVVVRTAGQGSSPGASIGRNATYRVIRWTDETTLDAMSSTVSDSHTTGNWQTMINQTITITSNSTIDRAYRYAVQLVNHTAANADPMHIVSVVANGTASSILV